MTSVRAADVQPRQLIVTIYGLYARAEQNWLSVSALVRLMADAGVDEAAVRSSVSRLKRRDVLRSLRRDAMAGYVLSESSLEILQEGDARIFARRRATLSDGWLVVVFSVPESERERRHELRSQLSRLGFGNAAPGVWVAPGPLEHETREVLERTRLSAYVDLFRGEYRAFDDIAAKVPVWWDLGAISARYAQFVDQFQPSLGRWRSRPSSDQDAFSEHARMLTAWRRLPYLDPGLPQELLPKNWNGLRAVELFAELDAAMRVPARKHALNVIHR